MKRAGVGSGAGRARALLPGLQGLLGVLGVFCALGVLASGPVRAQPPQTLQPPQPAAALCPAAFPVEPPHDRAAGRRELQRLEGLAQACAERADYFAWAGLVLLTGGQPQQAAIALEKALLLDPDLPGAELDYAQALAELGERAPARQLVQSVLARPDIPHALHDWLTSREAEWNASSWRWHWQAQSLLGSESNLNSAPASRNLTLTLPGGDVPLLLAESEQPRSGTASLNSLALEAVRPLGPGRLTLSGTGTLRASPGESGSDLRWIDGAAALVRPLGGIDAGARLESLRLWLGGVDLYHENALKLFAERPLPWAACRAGAGLEADVRNYPASPLLDGRYRGGQLGAACRQDGASLSLLAQWGIDRAQDPLRLGGDQQRRDLQLSAGKPLGPGMLSLTAQWSRLQDADIYSPLLGDVPREILRRVGRIQYEYPLTRKTSAVGYLEKTSQNSNIGLFAQQNNALYLGLRWTGN